MKTFFIFACVLIITVSTEGQIVADDLGEFSNTEKGCMRKLNFDEFTIDYYMKQLYMPEDNTKFTKFMTCVWKQDGFIDEKDNLLLDKFKEFITETYAEAVRSTKIAEAFATDSVNSCSSVKGDTPGERGIKFMNCVTRLSQN